ncbi:MAG: lytic transglycosylase domain-containing protein [Bacillota bacterium]|nr:lytic transglycosylase domain-containing protein [Bacillota bacterium]
MEPVDRPDLGRLLLQQWIAANLVGSPEPGGATPPEEAGVARSSSSTSQPPAAPASFRELFQRAAARYGLDARLLEAVARVESGFNPDAVSAAGAVGLMQLMPETARAMGARDPLDPVQNVEAGARYLKELLDRFGDVRLALAAYNAGPAAVERFGDVPPYPETVEYIRRVLNAVG